MQNIIVDLGLWDLVFNVRGKSTLHVEGPSDTYVILKILRKC